MKKNMRDFINNMPEDNKSNNDNGEEEITLKVKNYSRMTESELMKEMNKIASEQKSAGNLNAESLQNFYKQVSPNLTEAQRNKLKYLINTLK